MAEITETKTSARDELVEVHARIRKAVGTVKRRELQLRAAKDELDAAIKAQTEITGRLQTA